MELYKKHRPKALRAMVGNEETVLTVQNLLSNNRLPHTLLLHGPSGCGKTTLARILRKELNCSEMDFKEINAADFRGIDMVRDINRAMHSAPLGGKSRIWLIDESHKLSSDAQNAFLKALEDTPSHVWFILCTTDPDKLLKTIRTRSCELSLQPLSQSEMSNLLTKVQKREKIELPEAVLDHIIDLSFGSPRQALVMMDKVIGLEEKDMKLAIENQARMENESIDLCRALIQKKSWKEIGSILLGLTEDPEKTRWAVLNYCWTILVKGEKNSAEAFLIIDAFQEPFYNSGKAGLASAAYEAKTSISS